MKNIEIKFYEATVFANKIMNFDIVDYNTTINNLDIHIVIDVDENGELTGNIRFYSCNYYSVYFESDEYNYEIELSDNYKNFALDAVRHFHHRKCEDGFSMIEYTKELINEATVRRFLARTIDLKYFEEV